jgi:two-component system, NarL family, sensor histidine kinase DegS
VSQERRRYERRADERERSLLADRLITAEQEERRRLALELHDGPVQSLSGIALMLDAAAHALETDRVDDAKQVLANVVRLQRETIRSLRDLSFNLEPVVLRDQGLGPAVQALADQLGGTHRVEFELRLELVDDLAERAQVALYQILREALNQAIARGPTRVAASVERDADGGVEATVDDDGAGERRRGGLQVLEERARPLEGEVASSPREGGGTTVQVRLPAHAVRR